MAVLRAALCLFLVFSMNELVIVSAIELAMNHTVIEAIQQNNLTAVFNTTNPECDISLLRILQALTNTTSSLNGTAEALNVSVDLLESGCLDFTPLEIAGLLAEPPKGFLKTATFDKVVKKVCESNSTAPTKAQLENVMRSFEKKGVSTNVTVAALVERRRLEENETDSFTVLQLVQTALNVTERDLIEFGLFNVSSDHLGFLNHTLDELACIVGVPKEKLRSFTLAQLLSVTYAFRPLMHRITNLVEIRRNSLLNNTVLQMANNDSNALTLLQLAVGNLTEYFAPFILNVPCQQAHLFIYTIDRLSQLTKNSVTELQHYRFNTLSSYILSIEDFLLSEMEAMRVKKEEVIKLSKVYGVTLMELVEAQGKSIREVLSMDLFEINNLLCYNSLNRYSKKSGKSMSYLAAKLDMTSEQLQKAPFKICRTLLSSIIIEDVQYTLGYPAATTDRLLSCNLAPALEVSFINRCDLMKRHSLSFTLEMYGKLTIHLYGKTVLQIVAFIGLTQRDLLTCNFGIRSIDIPKLNEYILSRIEMELEMVRYTIFSKNIPWIIQKVITDPDECKNGIDSCHKPWATCTNTLLSYKCECPSSGQYLEPYCEDVDECTTKAFPYNCHDGRQFCYNMPGSFSCGGCYKGYQKVNDTYCEDEDECAAIYDNTCHWSKQKCINTIGSYACACGHGLRRITPTRCDDVNECDLQPAVCEHIPNAQCNNVYGGYSCDCPVGFDKVMNSTNDLHNCTDMDECTLEPGICREEHEECKNIPGKYTCLCKEGYERHRGKCQEKRPHFAINFGLAFFLRWRGISAEVQVPGGLPYCGEMYEELWIHSNGLISIGPDYSTTNPKSLDSLRRNVLAPFWANTDLPHGARVAYQVLDRSDKDQVKTMNEASQLISDSENLDSSFNATWVLIVSWGNVCPYWPSWSLFNNPYEDEKNTFLAVVATNGTHSYAVFIYEDMDWHRTYLGRRAAVGFASKESSCKYQVPGSLEKAIFDIDDMTFEDKSGKKWKGLITLSLNSDKIPETTDLQRCIGWYEEEPEPEWAEDLPQCPCDEMAAQYNPEFNLVSDVGLRATYELNFPDGDPEQYGQQCVYQRFYFWNSGSLLVGPNNGGSAQRYHWSIRNEHNDHDQEPYNWCCASRTTDNRYCYLYYEKRPSSDCGQSRPLMFTNTWFGNHGRRRFRFHNRRSPPMPFLGILFGDPHITTLDGVKYTFNGLGDYVLIRVNNTFAFHGRTVRPITPDGPANATVFSGFAISQAGGDTVQVHFSADKPDNMSITVVSSPNCSNYVLSDFENAKTFNKILVRKVSHKNKTLRVSAPSGISVDISPGLLGMLNLAAIVPEIMNNRTQGLMGKMNRDKSDDYAYRNGTILTVVNATDSQQQIFDMGQSWKVRDTERLFVFIMNSSCVKENLLFDENYKPAFFSWDSLGDLRENATRICGTSNLECLFDIAQTRNVAVGEETAGFEKESNKIKEALNNQPPVIHGPASVKAECGKTVEFQVSATDPNNDTLSYMVSGLPAGATFDNNTATITWNVTNAKNVSIIVIVTDKLGASTQQAITVNLCCCQNNGECSFNQTVIGKGTEHFRFMKCNCTALYDGNLCENGRDPCADKPCYDDTVSCNKSKSNDKGYTCSACPQGLTGNGEDCVVLDKCALDNGGCGQICNNSLGPVTCGCRPGFILKDDGKNCTDIDECDGSNDCGANTTCTNGPGNYSCECRKGFEGNPKTSCTDINECNNGVAQCSQECKNLPGTFKCSCRQGFQLANNNITCEDIDECKFAITNKCQMKCINLVSTYNCSCPAGFQLNSDHQTCDVAPSSKCDSTNGGCVNGLCTNSSGNITCHCTSGFNLTVDGKTCEDVDECQRSNHGCRQNCINLRGGYNCSCLPGFTLLHDKRTCQDIDECKSKPCSTDAKCANRQGSYNCKCNAGYSGDGKTCSNINECEESSPCSKDKTCTDLAGSYSCSCRSKQADVGSGCERVKQFYLSCRFLRVGTTELIWRSEYSDTASTEYKKLANVIVTETDNFGRKWFKDIYRGCKVRRLWEGSIRANISLFFNPNATVSVSDLTNTMSNASEFGNLTVDPSAAKVTDPNECSDPQSNDCHPKATCINTQGSYDCKCNAGYEGDGLKCEPEITENKEKDNSKLILVIVIPLVCILLLLVICCACTYYHRKKNRKGHLTSDEQHEYIHKHQLTERGAGRPINSNEYVVEASDKNSRKVSASSEESGPMYDNPDETGSYDVSQGAYVNAALGDASLPMYDNPAATGSYDMSQGAYVNPASSDEYVPMYDNPNATGSYDVSQGDYVDVDVSVTLRNTTQHNTTQHDTTRHDTTRHNATQRNATQHNTTQHNTMQRNAMQCNMIQHNPT